MFYCMFSFTSDRSFKSCFSLFSRTFGPGSPTATNIVVVVAAAAVVVGVRVVIRFSNP